MQRASLADAAPVVALPLMGNVDAFLRRRTHIGGNARSNQGIRRERQDQDSRSCARRAQSSPWHAASQATGTNFGPGASSPPPPCRRADQARMESATRAHPGTRGPSPPERRGAWRHANATPAPNARRGSPASPMQGDPSLGRRLSQAHHLAEQPNHEKRHAAIRVGVDRPQAHKPYKKGKRMLETSTPNRPRMEFETTSGGLQTNPEPTTVAGCGGPKCSGDLLWDRRSPWGLKSPWGRHVAEAHGVAGAHGIMIAAALWRPSMAEGTKLPERYQEVALPPPRFHDCRPDPQLLPGGHR